MSQRSATHAEAEDAAGDRSVIRVEHGVVGPDDGVPGCLAGGHCVCMGWRCRLFGLIAVGKSWLAWMVSNRVAKVEILE